MRRFLKPPWNLFKKPVSTTPTDNLPPLSTTPAANFATNFASVVDTGGKFVTGVNLPARVNDTGGK
jgi:hypothetical protein